jgi:hypothetical protein
MKALTIIGFIFGLLLAGCTTAQPTASVAMVRTAIAQTQEASPPTPTLQNVAASMPASLPESTEIPIPSPTLSLIATKIAEPKPVFEYAKIHGIGHLDTGHVLITVEIPGELLGSYHALVENEVFDCKTLPDYPNRLYCTGLTSYQGKFVQFSLIESRSQVTVFQTEIGIPPSPYTAQNVDKKAEKSTEEDSDRPTPTPTLPAYPYP